MTNRRQLLLGQGTHAIDFAIEADWLHCYGYRLFDLSWPLVFSVWLTTWPLPNVIKESNRRNPTDALRVRLNEAGVLIVFFGDEFVWSLIGRVAAVDFASLMDTMKAIAVGSPDDYSTPIVLLD